MKISVLQQDLFPALQAVSRSVGNKNLPVLANVLLKTKDGKLELSATNLEIGIIKKINVEVLEEGAITVPARTFLEVVQPLSGSKLELEAIGDQLKIITKNFSGSLNGIAASEFPQIPVSSEQSVLVSAELLKNCLPEITFAAASDEGRPVLTGILTEIKKERLELVATDGFRLAHKTSQIEGSDGLNFRSLIPRRTFEEIVRLIGEDLADSKDEKIELATSENQNQMVFTIGQTTLSSRLIEGQFPTWEKIIPSTFVTRVVVDKGEMIKAVKLASVFARSSESNIIRVETQKNKLKFTSEAKQLGAQESEVEAQVEGEELVIAFNSKFLLDALTAAPSSQLSIEFSGALSPTLIKPIGEKDLEFVVMPIRVT
jgi:DNA polymerase III subunit beta